METQPDIVAPSLSRCYSSTQITGAVATVMRPSSAAAALRCATGSPKLATVRNGDFALKAKKLGTLQHTCHCDSKHYHSAARTKASRGCP